MKKTELTLKKDRITNSRAHGDFRNHFEPTSPCFHGDKERPER